MESVDQFLYLGSNISSNESDVDIRIGRLSTKWKSDFSDNIKREFF